MAGIPREGFDERSRRGKAQRHQAQESHLGIHVSISRHGPDVEPLGRTERPLRLGHSERRPLRVTAKPIVRAGRQRGTEPGLLTGWRSPWR